MATDYVVLKSQSLVLLLISVLTNKNILCDFEILFIYIIVFFLNIYFLINIHLSHRILFRSYHPTRKDDFRKFSKVDPILKFYVIYNQN